MIYKIQIIDDSFTDITRHADPGTEYDCDDEHTSHYITGFRLSKNFDLEISFPPKINTNYYLVYYLFSTGCSYCHTSGRIEFVELYRNEKAAKAAARLLNNTKTATVKIKNDSGKIYQEYKSGVDDYLDFGSFDGAYVETVQLQK